MARKHTYHKENCDCLIREIIVDNYGREIILGGQHAFQYSISIISITGKVTTTNYRNGKEARKKSSTNTKEKNEYQFYFKRKHKYLVTFYKPSRVRKYICTRTIGSALQFALKKSFKYGVFTIKRLDK